VLIKQLSDGVHRAQYVELLRLMIGSTHSERGWAWTGKIVEKSVSCLTSIYFTEMRMLNPEDYGSEGESPLGQTEADV
jgi:proteasome activator subunit 4